MHSAVIHFFCGLAFFTLGVLVLARLRPVWSQEIAGWLKWLGLFGLLHGAGEWLAMARVQGADQAWQHSLEAIAAAGSFAALLFFGLTRVSETRRRILSSGLIVSLALCLWILAWLATPVGIDANIIGRYLLGLPAIIVVTVCIFRQRHLFGDDPGGRWLFLATLTGFALYVVPTTLSAPGDIFVASVLSYTGFEASIGTPVLIWRVISAVAIIVILSLALDRIGLQEKEQLAEKAEAAAAELRESRERFRDAVDNMIEGVVVHRNFKILFANQTAADIFGYASPEELLALDSSLELISQKERERLAGFKNNRQEGTKTPEMYEYQGLRKDGSEVWLENRVSYISEDRKTIQSITVDISKRKLAEEEVRLLNAELEQRIEDRTRELEALHRELLQQEKLATLGQLTATVTHELRNPLGTMRTSIYLLRQKDDGNDPKTTAAIERIERNVVRCDTIIDELLDFTRIRPVEFQHLLLDAWLDDLLDEQQAVNGVEVVRDFGADAVRVHIDPERLRRAVINLYDNAAQAMTAMEGSEGLTVRKLTVQTRSSGNNAEIIISDTGIGIAEEVLEQVFEPMFSTKGFGVGLGLPVVRKIAEEHHGSVRIINNNCGGTQATLALPLCIPAADIGGKT
jgi:PAS domain S-box-containing protein